MMRSRIRKIWTISINAIFAACMILQSCDSTLNIDEPREFYKYIGSEGDQWAVDLVADAEDNIYILGRSSDPSEDNMQLYVVKTSPKGIVIWEKKFGGSGDEDPKDIEFTSDGNLILVTNYTDLASGARDFVIYRLNADDGSVIGSPAVSPNTGEDYANSITEISDGFIVSSYSDNGAYKEAFVYRYNSDLQIIPSLFWNVNFSQAVVAGGYDFIPVKVIQMSNDLFYTFCYTNTTLNGDGVADYNFFIYVSNQFNDLKNALAIPGDDPNTDERLASVKAIPPQSGSGFILAGYSASLTTSQQNLYVLKVVRDLEFVLPSDITSNPPPHRVVTNGLSSITPSSACVFPSKGEGFFLLGDQNSQGNDNIFLTKVDNSLNDAWSDPHPSFSFGGAGNDMSGAVVETSDGRILLCGTMVLGDVVGQKKVVLMNLSPKGLFGE